MFGVVVLCGAAVGASLVAAGGAQTPEDLEAQADAVRAQNHALAAGSQSALASLTAIESRLAQARAELASFRARSAEVGAQRRAVTEQLAITRSAVRLTRKALATRLQNLYEEGNPDVLAVVLGAGSLDDALSAVETLDLAARQDEDLVQDARGAATRLARLGKSLAAKQRELDQLAAVKAATTASLVSARSERQRAIAALRATSGRAVGWGIVAVDPTVIPMGSRIAIPGYGMGVAADTGGAVAGARIDLWFPSVAQAHEWGTRTVTVTVYPN